jgi:DNA repair photolyase
MKSLDSEARHVSLKTGIARSPEFEKKGLATHGLNVGLLCGHLCKYCSTPSLHRTHPWFPQNDVKAFDQGLVVVDPNTLKRIRKDLHKLNRSDVVQISTTTDVWSPESNDLGLGRECLKALLEESECQVRVLTKNVAVANEFDLIKHTGTGFSWV